jgi:autotransporter adhesin
MFDGNGNWTSDFSAQADRDNGIKILASRFDNIFIADIKESFENCLTKDGQIMPIGNFNMGGQRITNMADGVNSNDAVNMSQLNGLANKFQVVASLPPTPDADTFYFIPA